MLHFDDKPGRLSELPVPSGPLNPWISTTFIAFHVRHAGPFGPTTRLGRALGALILTVVLLVPVSKIVKGGEGQLTTQGLAGGAIAERIVVDSTTTVDPTTTAAAEVTTTQPEPVTVSPTVAPTAAPTVAPTAAPTAAPTPATTAKPVVTTAKAVATTVKPKPVATTVKAPATTKAPVTTAKPVATTAKPAATTARPVATTPRPTVTPTAPPTTAAPVTRYTADQVIAMIREAWPDDSEERAIEIARRESGWRNWAYNGSCCYGVFQIHYNSHKRRLTARGLGLAGLYDPRVNIAIALEIFQEQGWSPWSTA